MQITVSHAFLPHTNSTRASIVMDHFGIGFEQGEHLICRDLHLPIDAGQVVLFTGASGSGKSSMMREVARQLSEHSATVTESAHVLDIDRLSLGDGLLIDAINLPVDESLRLLSSCGLGEAQLLLRTPAELSDGQRYRFRLALALSLKPRWIVADEFTATLDRTLARVVAFNVRKLAQRTGTGFLLATTHDDLVDDLQPDLHVRCSLDGDTRVALSGSHPQESAGTLPVKKKRSPSNPRCGSPAPPRPTGRTSLGGITAATTSD